MLAERPWLRTTLFVLFAAIILVAVGAFAYSLGARNGISQLPANAQFSRSSFDGPQGNFGDGREVRPGNNNDSRQPGPGMNAPGANGPGANDNRAATGYLPANHTTIFGSFVASRFVSPWLLALRFVIGALVLAALVLGVMAFFRTGGLQPAPVEVEKAAKKK